MITFAVWQAVMVLALAGIGAAASMQLLARKILRWVNGRTASRVDARLSELRRAHVNKILPHAPSGTVGLCIEVTPMIHRRWGFLGARILVQLVPCADCASMIQQAGIFGIMRATGSGHLQLHALSEVTAARADEIAKFKEAMQQGGAQP